MAGRVLKALEEQGLLAVSGKTIVVLGATPTSDEADSKLTSGLTFK